MRRIWIHKTRQRNVTNPDHPVSVDNHSDRLLKFFHVYPFFFRFQHFWNWNEERHVNLKGKVMATPMFLFLSWLTKKIKNQKLECSFLFLLLLLLSMSIIKPRLNFTQLYTRNKGTRTGRCWRTSLSDDRTGSTGMVFFKRARTSFI